MPQSPTFRVEGLFITIAPTDASRLVHELRAEGSDPAADAAERIERAMGLHESTKVELGVVEDEAVIAALSLLTMIAEFPDPVCLDTAGSTKIEAMTAARTAFIAACGLPSRSRFVPLEGRATIDGVGFFDVKHGTPQRGVAPNNIELHPVLRYRSFGCQRP